jgi:CheY-like chemotaxis protein
MIRVCCYQGCGAVYGEKEPFADRSITHGYCPKHLEITLSEIKADMEKRVDTTKPFKVLIVEDSSFFRETFISQLRKRFASVEIDGAGDGGEALQKVDSLHPNLIFMDIRLPGENGLELTRKIKASFPDIIVIIFTNYDLPEYREAATRYGADYFFPKDSSAINDIFELVQSIMPERA